MRKLLHLKKMLLVAAGLLVGASAWADYDGYRAKYTQDFEGSIEIYKEDWNINGEIVPYSGTANDGKVFVVRNGSTSGEREVSISFSNNENFTSATDYIFEFDWGWLSQNKSENRDAQLTVSSASGTLFVIKNGNYNASATITNASESELATLPGEGTYTSTKDTPINYFHFVLKANESGIKLTVTKDETTYVDNVTLSETFATLSSIKAKIARNYGIMAFDNFKLYLPFVAGTCDNPDYKISGVSGTSRKFTLSCDTEESTIYYSETQLKAEDDGWTTYSGEVTTSAETIYAYAKTNESTSEVISFKTGAGQAITLNAPTISVSDLTLNNTDGLYYQTIAGNYKEEGVLFEPKATLSATFNGGAVSLPYVATTTGTLVITASYDGYTSSTYSYEVVGYTKALWQDYTTLETSGLPTGIRKWSGDEHWSLAEGYGIKAIREGGNAWVQIDRAGMIAYDKLSTASEDATTEFIIVPNNDNTGNNSLQYFANGTILTKIYYFTEGNSVTVSDAGFATYVNNNVDLDFSETEIEAYTVKVSRKGVATLTKVKQVPAGTPVLLYKENGATEAIPVITGAAAVENNDLVAGTGATVATIDGEYTNMILNNVSGIGFYFANNQTVAADRAYLHIKSNLAPDAASGTRMAIIFGGDDDGTTGISEKVVVNSEKSTATFNLNGQRVAQPTKGLYIVNGKKVILK